jgi:hypothetical protein
MTPILVLPHMHEHGSAFLSDLVSEAGTQSIIEVTQWSAGMRDMPPLRDFLADAQPTVYQPGDQIRVFCTWDNPGSQEVRFPAEMCASVGYFWSDAATADDYLCPGSNKISGR